MLAAIAARPLDPPPERLIASGVLTATADAVAEAYARHGLAERERRVPRRLGGGRAGARMIRLAMRVDRAHAEAVLAELLELAPGGLEERESTATRSST